MHAAKPSDDLISTFTRRVSAHDAILAFAENDPDVERGERLRDALGEYETAIDEGAMLLAQRRRDARDALYATVAQMPPSKRLMETAVKEARRSQCGHALATFAVVMLAMLTAGAGGMALVLTILDSADDRMVPPLYRPVWNNDDAPPPAPMVLRPLAPPPMPAVR
ncbi:MAG: hypothetical protein JSS43_16250 [Proteobacteria bacterium]|nr:hypothetical protein [Pseudomonadota bacterium]